MSIGIVGSLMYLALIFNKIDDQIPWLSSIGVLLNYLIQKQLNPRNAPEKVLS